MQLTEDTTDTPIYENVHVLSGDFTDILLQAQNLRELILHMEADGELLSSLHSFCRTNTMPRLEKLTLTMAYYGGVDPTLGFDHDLIAVFVRDRAGSNCKLHIID